MDPSQFLREVWGQQGRGFGFISLRPESGGWYDLAIKFPDEWEDDGSKLNPFLAKTGDLYFTPNLFSRPRRRKELVLPSRWLYADLDTVRPQDIDDPLPTMAWESSPGRYQCLWLLNGALGPAEHMDLNKRMTYYVGADKGGWDLTQVLRIPGTKNHKYDEKPTVKLLWA